MNSTDTMLPNVYLLGYHAGEALGTLLWKASSSISSSSSSSPTCTSEHSTTFGSATAIWWDAIVANLDYGIRAIASFPALYKDWWLHLVAHDPVHVLVETTLIVTILYILWTNNASSASSSSSRDERLSVAEQKELLREWKDYGRASLTPPQYVNPYDRVVHACSGRVMEVEIATSASEDSSSSASASTSSSLSVLKTVLNFGTLDFLGRSGDLDAVSPDPRDEISRSNSSNDNNSNGGGSDVVTSLSSSNPLKVAARAALDKYGCGACGPRGFYGTIDVHLQLERAIADFVGADNAILYSDGASTCSSTVAAFCKRGDLLLVDEAVYEPLATGVLLSRAHVKWFKHNDMQDLRRVMEKVQQADGHLKRKSNAQRRFLVVEGLYRNTGSICHLDTIVQLKHEFGYRILLDESHSFGTLGPTGRGVLELYNKRLQYDVEIMTISLEHAVGGIGGVTVGSDEVVDHQRLSGSGYCFSASSPPFTAVAALVSLELMKTRPDIYQRLQHNQAAIYQQLQAVCHYGWEDAVVITSDPRSPLILLQLAPDIAEAMSSQSVGGIDAYAFWRDVAREALVSGGVAVTATHTTTTTAATATSTSNSALGSHAIANAALRVTVSASHTANDLEQAVQGLTQSVETILRRVFPDDPSPGPTTSTSMNNTTASSATANSGVSASGPVDFKP